MGVFTSLTAEEIKTHLKGYDLGELDYFEAITEGIENSNYLIATHRHDHQFLSILTVWSKATTPQKFHKSLRS